MNLYGRYAFRCKTFITIFSLKTQQINVKLEAIDIEFNAISLYPLLFFPNTPLKRDSGDQMIKTQRGSKRKSNC